jgi:hypothetical protein
MADGKRGRPSLYTEAIADAVVAWIEDGKTLRSFCRQVGMPSRDTIDRWRREREDFSHRVARARDDGFAELAEECLAIADTPQLGEIVTEEAGGEDGDKRKVVTEDMLGHRKLQVETRLKLLACWDPKRYGTQRTEHTGSLSLETLVLASRKAAEAPKADQ